VIIGEYAQRHFIKSFEKKYGDHWDVTLIAIIAQLERIDSLLKLKKIETISDIGAIKILKMQFKVAMTNESARSSGNRCIVAWHADTQIVRVLLVYSKTDLSGKNETAEWKNMIRENYPEYKELCK
jgi:hypothetical protein